jgi:hypothetical protein
MEKNSEGNRFSLENKNILIEEMDGRYHERKSLIKRSDDELSQPIFKVIQESQGSENDKIVKDRHFKQSLAEISGQELFLQIMQMNLDSSSMVLALANEKPLINIGSGGDRESLEYAITVAYMLGANKQELIDPFFNQTETNKRIDEIRRLNDCPTMFVQDDGLRNLANRLEKSSNVFISTVNSGNVWLSMGSDRSADWLSRVAQESYRVVPENGVLVCLDSEDVAYEAEKIFGNRIHLAIGFDVFVKGNYTGIIENISEYFKSFCSELLPIITEARLELKEQESLFFLDIFESFNKVIKDNEVRDISYNPFRIIYNEIDGLEKSNLSRLITKYGEDSTPVVYAKKLIEVMKRYPKANLA